MIYKQTLSFSRFALKISAMAGYYHALQNDPEWGDDAKYVNSLKNTILRFAYCPLLENEDEDCDDMVVHYTIADEDLETFYSLDTDWAQYDPEPMDLKKYFIEKQQQRIENYEKKRQQIMDEYQKYLDSDEVNAQGRKSQADFARKHGYNPNSISAWLSGRNRPQS